MPPPEVFAGRRAQILVVLLLSWYGIATATSAARHSIAFDELGHLTGGFASWVAGDFRLFPQNGQLPQRWAALPLVMLGYRFPSLDQDAWRSSNLERVGYQFLYDNDNDHEKLLWTARLAMIPIGMLLGAICYAWARRLFGTSGGLIALSAFVFSPGMLAHGPLATSDVSAALLFTVALGCFWRLLHRASVLRLVGSTLAFGALFVTKMSAVVIVPVAVILVAVRAWDGRPLLWDGRRRLIVTARRPLTILCWAMLAAHLLVAATVIWGFYDFRYATFHAESREGDQQFLGETIDSLADGVVARPLILRARDLRLLPEAYLFGFAHVLNRSGEFIGFMNGRYRAGGWWSYFPYTWLVKTPVALFALLALAAAYGCRTVWRHAAAVPRLWRRAYELVPLVVFLLVYWTVAVTSDLNLGERHLLPSYPMLFVLAGAAAGWIGGRWRSAKIAIAALLLALSVEAIGRWPHYLSYFNAIGGGPAHGYRHLVDSSFDWGQDLPALRRWVEAERARGSQSPIYLSYFGSGNPSLDRLDVRQVYSYRDWRPEPALHELHGGVYCISATMLQSVYTRAPGPWAAEYESAYQRLKGAANQGTLSPPLALGFDQLRVARLAAYLRRREPDDRAGYSILIYRLSDRDVHEALEGPPAELWPHVGIEGW